MNIAKTRSQWLMDTISRLKVFVKIRIHPLFILLLVAAWLTGLFWDALVLFIIVILHELGHAIAANELGFEVERVSLLPFGGVARLRYGHLGFRPRHEAIVAIAGPFVNLLIILLGFGLFLSGLWSEEFYHLIVKMNLWLVVFNMLPGLPLDGGRILRAARSRLIGFESATREAYRVALAIAVILLCMGVVALWAGHPHIGIIILGIFLLLTAISGGRDTRVETVRFLDSMRKSNHRQSRVVRSITLPKTAPVRDALIQFAPNRYHIIYVLSENGEVQDVLEEKQLIDCMFSGNWLTPVGDWIQSLRD